MSDSPASDPTQTASHPASASVCLFLAFPAALHGSAERTDDGLHRFEPIADRLSSAPGHAGLRVHVPSQADDPYLKDADGPALVLQLYFEGLEALEAALQEGSVLHGLVGDGGEVSAGRLDGAATWQVTSVQRVELESTAPLPPVHCTYLVAYEGTSADEAAWHGHYAEHHVPLMKRLPGLRQLEVYRPLATEPVAPALAGFTPVRAMQRNKVVFDSPQALTAALNSPIRHEMRKDYQQAPPFTGRSTHHPMATRSWP